MADHAALKKMRPWYFVIAMCLTWVSGVVTATSSCKTVSYLRGDQEMIDQLREQEQRATQPLFKVGIYYEQARLHALAQQYQRAFPLSVAQVLLGVLLTLVSGAALAGRKSSRDFAIQVLAAVLALGVLAYALQSSVRQAMLQAISDHTPPIGTMSKEQSRVALRNMMMWAQHAGFVLFDIMLPLFALFALTRQRTRGFFEAVEAAQAASEQS